MRFNYIIYLSFLIGFTANVSSQNCSWHNSSPNINYCCGHDPLLDDQLQSHKLLSDGFGYNYNNFCWDNYYDKLNLYGPSAIPGDWFLIWYDDFDYGTLDESFYRPDFGWGNFDIHGHPSSVAIPQNVSLSNGKLILKAFYDGKTTKQKNWEYGVCVPCPDNYFDYTVSAVKTHMAFPLNSRFHTNVKIYPNPKATWSALWLRGDNGYEIDMFEMVGHPTEIDPEKKIKMTYHSAKYGYTPSPSDPVREEGVEHGAGGNLTTTFNNFDLIWDKWKIDWYYNSNVVHHITKYYYIPTSWTNSKISKYYRANPIKDYNTFVSHYGKPHMVNKFFPDKTNPQNLIFNVSVQANASPSDVGPGKTQEMDNLTIWLRADCNATDIVTSNNPVPSSVNPSKSSYEMGKIVRTLVGGSVKIPSGYFAIYAATQSVELLDGFSVDQDANFFAFISSCGGAWDHRMGSDYELNEPKYDIIEDIPDDSDIKEYSTQTTFNSETRHDILLKNFETSFSLVCNTGTLYDIEIYNVQGALVFSKYNNTTNEIEISKDLVAPGIYMARSTTPAGVDVRKLWIIR